MGEDPSTRLRPAGRAPGGHPGTQRCPCLWHAVSTNRGSPLHLGLSSAPPFLTRDIGSILSGYTSSLLGGFGQDATASMQGLRGVPSIWPGCGPTQGSPATSWLHFCRVQGRGGATWNDTLSVGCPPALSRTTLDTWGIRKSTASRRPGPGLSFPGEGRGRGPAWWGLCAPGSP